MMTRSHQNFVNAVVADLAPVRPLNNRKVAVTIVVTVLAGFVAVALTLGIRTDVLVGTPNPIFLLRGGLLLMLGSIATASALAMIRPVIGRNDRCWAGAAAMAAVVPVVALVYATIDPVTAVRNVWRISALLCLGVSLTVATGFATIIVRHLRRGTPVLLERAGWVTGIASGSLGALVYSLYCTVNDLTYIGTWYTLTIVIAAVAGRLAVPSLIRW